MVTILYSQISTLRIWSSDYFLLNLESDFCLHLHQFVLAKVIIGFHDRFYVSVSPSVTHQRHLYSQVTLFLDTFWNFSLVVFLLFLSQSPFADFLIFPPAFKYESWGESLHSAILFFFLGDLTHSPQLYFFLGTIHTACEILVSPQLGIEPETSLVKALSLIHWTSEILFFKKLFLFFLIKKINFKI